MGMDPAYTDALIVICMACFFTTVVRAPLTGIVMTFELTWNFAFLLPVAIGVAVGYFAGELTRTTPVYTASSTTCSSIPTSRGRALTCAA